MAVKAVVYDTNPIRYVYTKGNGGGGGASIPAWAAASSTYMIDPAATTPIEPATSVHEFMAQAIGEGTPTFDTPADLLLPDYEGVYHPTPEDTMPVHGSRVVQNYIGRSDDLTQDWGVTGGATIVGSDEALFTGTNSNLRYAMYGVLAGSDSPGVVLPVTATWTRVTANLVTGGGFTWLLSMEVRSDDKTTINPYIDNSTATNTLRIRDNLEAGTLFIRNIQIEFNVNSVIPSEFLATDTARNPTFTVPYATKYFTNLNGNTVTDNVVTEAVGLPLQSTDDGTLSNLYAWSRDLTNAMWNKNATPVVTYDQIGIEGTASTASLITDDNASLAGNVFEDYSITSSTNPWTSRIMIKRAENRDCELTSELSGGTNITINLYFNLSTGVFTERTVSAGGSYTVDLYDGWWVIYLSQLDNGTGNTNNRIRLWPTDSTVVSETGSITVGNIELFENKTIAQIRGKSAMVTEGSTGGTPTQIGQFPSLYAAPAMTNIMLWSNDMSNAAWVKTDCTAEGPTTSPSGLQLCKITSTVDGLCYVDDTILSSASPICGSYILQRESGSSYRYAFVYFVNLVVGFPSYGVWVDLDTGVLLSSTPGLEDSAVEDLGNGAYRVWIGTTTLAGDGNGRFYVRFADSSSGGSGTTGDTAWIGYASFYEGLTIAQVRGSAPIVTEGATVTNTVISINYDLANHDQTQGGYFADTASFAEPTGTNRWITTSATSDTIANIRGSGTQVLCSDGATNAFFNQTYIERTKLGTAYGTGDNMAINGNGVWSSAVSYDGAFITTTALFILPVNTGPNKIRNIQRWDLNYTDAVAKIDELMS